LADAHPPEPRMTEAEGKRLTGYVHALLDHGIIAPDECHGLPVRILRRPNG
jgi:hypothetical protein